MTTTWSRIRIVLDVASACAMIAASVAVIWMLFAGQLSATRSAGATVPARSVYQPGDLVDFLAPDQVADAPTGLVLFLREGCRYCDASMDFYKRLQAAKKATKLIVAGSASADSLKQYVAGRGLQPDLVLSTGTARLKVAGTPTLLVIGPDRLVRSVWRGQLDKDREQQLLLELR